MEEYAREAFPVEEAANGLTWMDEPIPGYLADDADDDEKSTGTKTPIHIPGVRTPFNHPEGDADDFFVGSC